MFIQTAPERLAVRNVQIDMLRCGSGPKLLYLHASDGVDSSDEFIALLSKRFEVIAPSHPGFAGSELPGSYRSVADLAYFYLDLIEALRLEDCVLVGSSFGGWIAAEIAIRCPSAISSLVLAAPLGLALPERDAPGITDLLSIPIARLPETLFSDREIGMKAFGGLKFSDMTEDAVTRFVRNRESLALFGWSPMFANPSLVNWLHRIRTNTLLIWGDEDKVLPTPLRTAYASRIPNTREHVIRGAGHYLHIERPLEFVNAIVEFAGTPAGNDTHQCNGRLQ